MDSLDAFRCPKCYGTTEVVSKEELGDKIITGEIRCTSCNTKYPIIAEIPYLAIIDTSWYPKIQELLATRDIHKAYIATANGATADAATAITPADTKVMDEREIIHTQQNQASQDIMDNFFEDVLTLLRDKKGLKICDIGAGPCETSAGLVDMGYEVTAVDIEYDDLIKAKPLVNKSYFERVMCDGERLPFKNNYFDIAFCRATLHHFNTLDQVIAEMVRITKEGGLFIAASEPIRSFFDCEFDYVKGMVDFQNGMNEHCPTFWGYFKVIRKNELKNLRVIVRRASLGLSILSKILGSIVLPSLKDKKELSHSELLKLLFVGAGVTMVATKGYESVDYPHPIEDKNILTDVTVVLDYNKNEPILREILRREGWQVREGQNQKI